MTPDITPDEYTAATTVAAIRAIAVIWALIAIIGVAAFLHAAWRLMFEWAYPQNAKAQGPAATEQ